MRRVLGLIAAAVLLFALVAGGGPATAAKGGDTAPAPAGLIYASDSAGGGVGVVAIRADGKGYTATCPGYPSHATPREFLLSREGDAALMWSSESCEPFVLLAPDGGVGSPTWSPDDSRVAFLGYEPPLPGQHPGPYTLYVADVVRDGALPELVNVRKVVEVSFYGAYDWAPTGDRFVLSIPNPAHKTVPTDPNAWSPPDLYVVSLSDGVLVNVTDTPRPEHQPSWSPDGTRFAFITQTVFTGNVRADVFTMPSTGGPAVQVTSKANTSASNNRQPVWSPDGAHLAFVCANTSNGYAHVCRIDASGRNKAVDLTPRMASYFGMRAWR